MTIARDIMHAGATCVGIDQTAAEAARMMADLDVGSLPICGNDDKLKGMVTDRDLVLKVMAAGKNPAECSVSELSNGQLVYAKADDTVDTVISTLTAHQIRRLPIIDEGTLVGMIAISDLARHLDDRRLGELVEAVSQN
ncbi:CBS domain-containing protein [Natronoglycomyces albus]|uniref:CBS domain-containing protein n=1 Tax=Natronoglycomyces albus TaxID=2811108 RepID=A0A895XLW5_9ACTN|nr:CBS domain-containing protein [Natronoglycomyces albus]QSB06087.1 CBS domain-containing protein [Natronoglycomyces albus]